MRANLGNCAGHLDPGRPPATKDESQHRLIALGSESPAPASRFRSLKGEQDFTANAIGVVYRIKTRRQPLSILMAKSYSGCRLQG